jgi:hypothetical protein
MTELNTTNTQLTTADIAAGNKAPGTFSPVHKDIARENVEPGVSKAANLRGRDNNAVTVDHPAADASASPLFSDTDIGDLRSRWSNLQAEFVDQPRRSVEAADELVATVMQRLAEGFARERVSLESKWDSGESASTEDLRMALQRYRAFFNRLLNAA